MTLLYLIKNTFITQMKGVWGYFESLYVIYCIMIFTVFNHDISLIYRIFLVFLDSFRVFACLGTFETYLEILEQIEKLRWRNELGDQIWRYLFSQSFTTLFNLLCSYLFSWFSFSLIRILIVYCWTWEICGIWPLNIIIYQLIWRVALG